MSISLKIKEMEKKAAEKMNSWQNNIALFAVTIQVNELRNKYKKYIKIQNFLKNVQKDILTNLNDFIEDEISNNPIIVTTVNDMENTLPGIVDYNKKMFPFLKDIQIYKTK